MYRIKPWLGLLLGLFLFAGNQAKACDVCGCSSSGLMLGLSPYSQADYFSLQWKTLTFEATDTDGNLARDYYHQWNIHFRHQIVDRLKLNVSIPLHYNLRQYAGESTSLFSLGDAMVGVDYQLIKPKEDSLSNWKLSWNVGLNTKLPTAALSQGGSEADALPLNFRVGSGSIDYVLQSYFAIGKKDRGIRGNVTIRLNTKNKDTYRYGNQLSAGLQFFQGFKSKTLGFTPYLGLYGEKIQRDLRKRIYQANTGGRGLFAQFGVDVSSYRWGLGLNMQQPFSQVYSNSWVKAASRASIRLTYKLF